MQKTLESRVKAQNASLKEKYDELDRQYDALVRKEKAWVPLLIRTFRLNLRQALRQSIRSINLSHTII